MQKIADCGLSFQAAAPGQPAYAPSGVPKRGGRHNVTKILRIMRLTIFLLTTVLVHAHATGLSQKRNDLRQRTYFKTGILCHREANRLCCLQQEGNTF